MKITANIPNVNKRVIFLLIIACFLVSANLAAQDQGFFLSDWQPTSIENPPYTDVSQTTDPVTISIKILSKDTLTRVSKYVFGDNANLWTGMMSNNKTLMQYMADRRMGVLRGPGGSISDIYFWNRGTSNPPTDIPEKLAGQTSKFVPWYGIRPNSGDSWTMAIDTFYSILKKTASTGMQTVNYGYARYGTGPTPVQTAAHMAANWVRYDQGRSKFWEIGNEVSGSWEAGYQIDRALNRDGQPEFITPQLYGQHCLVFIDSMKTAATQLGLDIKIGVVMSEAYGSGPSTWNREVANIIGDRADFYIVHSYYTPYNQSSGVETILNSYRKTSTYKKYVYSEIDKASKPHLPVALTEYNIFATGLNQPVSHVNGMHALLVTGEAIKQGLGAALRWDLANGWDNGNDHGMYSYGNEPNVSQYAPRPAFYHLYFMRRFTGDVMLNTTQRGDTNVVVYATGFASGQVAVTLVNKGRKTAVARLNIQDFKYGSRYYSYTLTGDNVDFSRRVYVNGTGTSLIAGGPLNYSTIPARSTSIGDEIRISLPPLSGNFVLIEPGDKELTINEQVYGIGTQSETEWIQFYPLPAKDKICIENLPAGVWSVRISDCAGRLMLEKTIATSTGESTEMDVNLPGGVYLITFQNGRHRFARKMLVSDNR